MAQIGVEVRTFDCAGDGERRPVVFSKPLPYEVCLVRRGCFRVRNHRGDVLADPATALLGGPGDEDFEVSHPHPGGDRDTFLRMDAATLAALGGGDLDLPGLAMVTPAVELAHRHLLAARARPDSILLEELGTELVAQLLGSVQPLRTRSGWPAARRRSRRIVEDARSALVADPDLSLVELASTVGCAPHHLSRLFRRETGMGVAAYRIGLHVQEALEGLADGAQSLADLAAACGFYDHAHLTRTLVHRFGVSPSALRAEWTPDA